LIDDDSEIKRIYEQEDMNMHVMRQRYLTATTTTKEEVYYFINYILLI